jgi:thiol-disulfide isomerase/thioredoxin
MKTSFLRLSLLLGCALLILNCGQQTGDSTIATVNSTFKNGEGELVYLEDVNGSSAYAIDTLVLKGSKGVLSANVQPGIYRIRVASHPGNHYALVFLDNDTRLDFTIDLEDPKNYKVSGSEENDLLKAVLKKQDELAVEARQIQEILKTERDFNKRDSLNSRFRDIVEISTKEVKSAVDESKQYDPNLAAYLLYLLDPKTHITYINSQLTELKAKDPDSKLIQNMVGRYAVQNNKTKSGLAIGSAAPEINQASPDGVNIPLSSLRGKYVLIDFWASWCRPCRFENPNVVRTYHKYKDKGFDIYSVSLDKNKDRWAKAINDDGLVWESHVSDLKAWSNQAARAYGVSSIPATFLVDPEGKIIARNLRGNALELKLKEIFGDA